MSTKIERKEMLEKYVTKFNLKKEMTGTGHSDFNSCDYLSYKDRYVMTINQYETNRSGFCCSSRYDYIEDDTANKDFLYQLSKIPSLCAEIDKEIEEEKIAAIKALEEEEKRREKIIVKIKKFKDLLSKNKGIIDNRILSNYAAVIIDDCVYCRRRDKNYNDKKLLEKMTLNEKFNVLGYTIDLTFESTLDNFLAIFEQNSIN